MKATLKVTIIGILLVVTHTVFGQDSGGYLMVNTYESWSPKYAKIVVTENGSLLEEVPLEKFTIKDIVPNQLTIHQTIDKYKLKGYSLVSMTRSNTTVFEVSTEVLVTTYLFEKK